jgi:hypothetical protein
VIALNQWKIIADAFEIIEVYGLAHQFRDLCRHDAESPHDPRLRKFTLRLLQSNEMHFAAFSVNVDPNSSLMQYYGHNNLSALCDFHVTVMQSLHNECDKRRACFTFLHSAMKITRESVKE